MRTPIFHPNVYPAGAICLGRKWLPTEGLDLLAIRIARIVSFDPELVNTASPANVVANTWYMKLCGDRPEVFPTTSRDDLLQDADSAKAVWRHP